MAKEIKGVITIGESAYKISGTDLAATVAPVDKNNNGFTNAIGEVVNPLPTSYLGGADPNMTGAGDKPALLTYNGGEEVVPVPVPVPAPASGGRRKSAKNRTRGGKKRARRTRGGKRC
jgi:hypothetical protein